MNMGASHLQQFISAVIQAKKKNICALPGGRHTERRAHS